MRCSMRPALLSAQPQALRIVRRLREDAAWPAFADDMHLDCRERLCRRALDIGKRETLPHMMSVRARGEKPNASLTDPHRLVAADIGIPRIDRDQHQALARALFALGERGVAPYKIALVEGDESFEPRHRRGVALGELQRPDAIAFLEA